MGIGCSAKTAAGRKRMKRMKCPHCKRKPCRCNRKK